MIFTVLKTLAFFIAVYNINLWLTKEANYSTQSTGFLILSILQALALFGFAWNAYLIFLDIQNLQIAVYQFLTK